MRSTAFVSICLFLSSTTTATWVSVRLASDSWVALKVVTPGKRYLLHPEALVTRLEVTSGCTESSPTQVTVRLWDQKTLEEANDAIKMSNDLCEESCRVEPYQARTIWMESAFAGLKVTRDKKFVPLTLPETIKFEILRKRQTRCPTISRQEISSLAISIEENDAQSSRREQLKIALTLDTSRLERTSARIFSLPRKSKAAMKLEAALKKEKEFAFLRMSLAKAEQALIDKQKAESQCAALKQPPAALINTSTGVPIISDCLDVKLRGLREGIYFLDPPGREVLCTATGELVVFRRKEFDVSFHQDWAAFRRGMGDPKKGDFFSGLDLLSQYTAAGDRCMRMILTSTLADLPPRMAQYSQFHIGAENVNFALNYEKFNGSITADPWVYHRGKRFRTFDRPRGDRCSQIQESGNWFGSCSNINLFGDRKRSFASSGMKAGLYASGESVKLKSAYVTLRKPGGDPAALRTVFSSGIAACPAVAKEWAVPMTGEYLITAGGAAGGTSPHFNSQQGGRGAVVRSRVFLERGTRLRLIIGCPGATGHASGAGGDGSFVANLNSSKLLAAAGGGGGAGWFDGGHGRREETGGGPIWGPDGRNASASNTTAFSWTDIAPKALSNTDDGPVSTGGRTYMDAAPASYAGGGGGGLQAGKGAEERWLQVGSEAPRQSSGGGGGSGCSLEALSCETQAGGNWKRNGFVTIGVYRCF